MVHYSDYTIVTQKKTYNVGGERYLGSIVTERNMRTSSGFHGKPHDLPLHQDEQQNKHLETKQAIDQRFVIKYFSCYSGL